MRKIIIIEDDKTFSKILESFLKRQGFQVHCFGDLKSGEAFLAQETADLLLLDFRLPDGVGLDLIDKLGVSLPAIPAVVITSFNDVRTAVKTMQSGAFEYIIKPIKPDELLLVIDSVFREKTAAQSDAQAQSSIPKFIEGTSPAARALYAHIDLVAPTEMSVMIIGESGTGKEHIAKRIHDLSSRKEQPFVAVDCGVLSKELAGSELFGHEKGAFTGALTSKVGMFEKANGGTLFLDEIGNLNYDVQIKLLRTIQERTIIRVGGTKAIPIDIRLIAATNDNLSESIKEGVFRMDLYHRINEFKIQLPALRDRGEDLALFIDFFIQKANLELGKNCSKISSKVIEFFEKYDWPGNLRELRNVVKRMVLLSQSSTIDETHLPEEMISFVEEQKSSKSIKNLQLENEKELILSVLTQTNYNKSKAAKILDIDRKTLYNKLAKYGIE